MCIDINEIRNEMEAFLGATVKKVNFVIWPFNEESFCYDLPNYDLPYDKLPYDELPMELNLKLKLQGGYIKNVTFRSGSDAQTPRIDDEEIEVKYEISELPKRIKIWKTPEFWKARDLAAEEQGEKYYACETFSTEELDE